MMCVCCKLLLNVLQLKILQCAFYYGWMDFLEEHCSVHGVFLELKEGESPFWNTRRFRGTVRVRYTPPAVMGHCTLELKKYLHMPSWSGFFFFSPSFILHTDIWGMNWHVLPGLTVLFSHGMGWGWYTTVTYEWKWHDPWNQKKLSNGHCRAEMHCTICVFTLAWWRTTTFWNFFPLHANVTTQNSLLDCRRSHKLNTTVFACWESFPSTSNPGHEGICVYWSECEYHTFPRVSKGTPTIYADSVGTRIINTLDKNL